jgi:hypothetical protein
MTQIGRKKKQQQEEDKNRVYNKKNTDLDLKLQIWLSFGPELIENKKNMKLMRMNQTTAKYDDNILEWAKSTKKKQVLKDNAKQTRYSKTKPDSGT